MNCSQSRSHFSEYLEKAVTPALERELRAHLERCSECAAELRELAVAIRRLRGTKAMDAPPALAANVTRRLLAASLPGPPAEAEAGPPRGREPARGTRGGLSRATLAAACLLFALAGLVAGHTLGSGAAAETATALRLARGRVESLERQLGATRTRLVDENSRLKHELLSLRSGLEQWKLEQDAALESERKAQRLLDQRLLETTRRVETQKESLARLETRLDATLAERDDALAAMDVAINERNALARELEAARTELAGAARAASRRAPAVAPREAADRHEFAEAAPVLVEREGDVLRLRTRGSLDEVGPHLFFLAETDAEPEIAELALTTLEARLAPYATDAVAEGASRPRPIGAEIVGWFNRNVGLANDAASDEPRQWRPDRGARLERLRRIWRGSGLANSPR